MTNSFWRVLSCLLTSVHDMLQPSDGSIGRFATGAPCVFSFARGSVAITEMPEYYTERGFSKESRPTSSTARVLSPMRIGQKSSKGASSNRARTSMGPRSRSSSDSPPFRHKECRWPDSACFVDNGPIALVSVADPITEDSRSVYIGR